MMYYIKKIFFIFYFLKSLILKNYNYFRKFEKKYCSSVHRLSLRHFTSVNQIIEHNTNMMYRTIAKRLLSHGVTSINVSSGRTRLLPNIRQITCSSWFSTSTVNPQLGPNQQVNNEAPNFTDSKTTSSSSAVEEARGAQSHQRERPRVVEYRDEQPWVNISVENILMI